MCLLATPCKTRQCSAEEKPASASSMLDALRRSLERESVMRMVLMPMAILVLACGNRCRCLGSLKTSTQLTSRLLLMVMVIGMAMLFI